jgi:hypothetical protein
MTKFMNVKILLKFKLKEFNDTPFMFEVRLVGRDKKDLNDAIDDKPKRMCHAMRPQYISFKYHFHDSLDVSPKLFSGKEILGKILLSNFKMRFNKSIFVKNSRKI